MSTRYMVMRADRASGPAKMGQTLYAGNCDYGCASDDTRDTGIEHISLSESETGSPTFTIPREDVLQLAEKKQ